jgi:superfamily II DNA or RNA helicase
MEELLSFARESSEARTWSLAVELARTAQFVEQPSLESDERVFRVIRGPKDSTPMVTLSEANQSWQCDCADAEDPCRHVLATLIAVRQGKVEKGVVRSRGAEVGSVVHSFRREGRFLAFERFVVWGETRERVESSLSAAIERLTKGRGAVAISKEEGQIDHVLPTRKSGVFDPNTLRLLLKALARLPHVELDGVVTRVLPEPLDASVDVVDEDDGFRVCRGRIEGCTETFENGAAVIDGAIAAIKDTHISADDARMLSGDGTFFSRKQSVELASVVIPRLQSAARVDVRSTKLPRVIKVAPRVVIQTIGDGSGENLTVVPRLVYGNPIIAEVQGASLECGSSEEVPARDRVEEARLVRELGQSLSLRLQEAKVFTGEAAIRFVEKLKGWQTSGEGTTAFVPARDLAPRVQGAAEGIDLSFVTEDGREASREAILHAWREGSSFVRLLDGGWGVLPRRWLDEHREAISRLLNARTDSTFSTAALLPEVDEVCASLGVEVPDYFAALKRGLADPSALSEVPLPADLRADLRSYQRDGVRWLSFLRAHRMGALLADDMGLGKTLQAMCVMRGRTLVVAPTSVLYGWERQLETFRPAMKVSRYHGPSRRLDLSADITLTTYAILRLDIDDLSEVEWDTIVLDESQTIKNPESQVAQAAYKLRGGFRINLSGTPVENSLEDLWSQLHFLNPGLLGTRNFFSENIERAVRSGDASAAARLRKKVAPFMLRRLKKDVAKELPPKTEVVLECELTEQERIVYDAVLATCQKEVVEKLSEGANPFSILEALLRLRQACCHSGLLPGQSSDSSSKVTLLIESLASSVSQGHRALVFSQWTSLLDKIEPHLQRAEISFSRIDGSTTDRDTVMREFQSPEGPSVMLLSLKAGGVGLNLTAADHVYIVDPWWNPAVEDQAADRAYRIGQENPVLVHRIVARDTIEERILELQTKKRALLSSAVGDGSGQTISREELLSLLR